MANDWYTPDNAHILRAKKGSMTAWRNADAKLESTEVQKMDELISFRLFEPTAIATPSGEGASYLGKYRTTSYAMGMYQEILRFQTAAQLYPSMGVCVTNDDKDINGDAAVGTYQHVLGIRTTQTPTWQGRHIERENTTSAESERIDVLGMLCQSHHIECSERSPSATQMLNWSVAYPKNSATDDIAASACDDEPFKWPHFTFPTFTYNSETIEAEIIGWAFDIVNTTRMTGLDSTYLATTGQSYYTVGKYIPKTYISVTLEIIPYGHNAFELIRTALAKYATDLDLTVKCTRTSLTDEIQWVHDKLYCTPYDIVVNKTPGSVESYFMRMHQLNTGSCVPTGADDYDDDYYET